MDQDHKQPKMSDEEFGKGLAYAFGAVVFFAIFVAGLYMWKFRGGSLSNEPEKWGQFGDYLGGVVNPAVGLVTVFLVVISIAIQRRELRASLTEMRHANEAARSMSLEQSLFAWLENYHSQIKAISHENNSGRRALQSLYDAKLAPGKTVGCGSEIVWLGNEPMNVSENHNANQVYIRIDIEGEIGLRQMGERQFYACIQYQRLYHDRRSDFDAPFRTLYRLIRWVDESDLTAAKKWHYCALIRSQLSGIELVFLYYNGLIAEGERLTTYANKYALFDNLHSDDALIYWAVMSLTPTPESERPRTRDGDKPWPYTRSAFNSAEAKLQLGLPAAL